MTTTDELRLVSHEANGLRLDVREAVAVRVVRAADSVAFYLSLFEDEIDERLGELTAQAAVTTLGDSEPDQVALNLEPTDALVVSKPDGTIAVARGGACNVPLYRCVAGGLLVVSTALPVDGEGALSFAGLLDSVAVAGVAYRHDNNVVLRAPLAGWYRLRRGGVSRLAPGENLAENLIEHARAVTPLGRDALIAAMRSALSDFGARQRRLRSKALVEFSGGIDSTVATLGARMHDVTVRGISVHFPFYEFRYEDGIQQAAAEALQVRRHVLDGTAMHSFTPPAHWPRLDEPATIVMAVHRNQTIAGIAAGAAIDRIYVGEGGDELFAEDMLEPLPVMAALPRELFSGRAWGVIERTRQCALAQPSLRNRSRMISIYDARLDVTMKEAYGTATRSPFTDLAMARCGLQWAMLTRELGEPHSKRILAEAFAQDMPDAVRDRRGKVCWDGVFARAYATHEETILAVFDRNRRVLGHLGIDVRWLTRRVGELARWERTTYGADDGAVFACYGLATWLESWGIRDAAEHEWMP